MKFMAVPFSNNIAAGVGGLYDFGPPGSHIFQNVLVGFRVCVSLKDIVYRLLGEDILFWRKKCWRFLRKKEVS